jgi:hypothetical protein
MKDTRGIVKVGEDKMKGDRCLHEMLGDRVDLEWSIKDGIMKISPTIHK